MMRPQAIRCFTITLAIVAGSLPTIADEADDQVELAFDLFDSAAKITEKAIDYLDPDHTLRVGSFELNNVANHGLRQAILDQLDKEGIVTVRPGKKADWSVEGEIKEPAKGQFPPQAVIQATFTYRGGDKPMRRITTIKMIEEDAVHELVSKTGEVLAPPFVGIGINDVAARPPFQQKQITVVRPSDRSPYAIEILVFENGQYRPLELKVDKDGDPYAEFRMGQIFAVRIHNGSDFDAGAHVIVDGINRFMTAKTEKWRGGYDVIRCRENEDSVTKRDIIGWVSDVVVIGKQNKLIEEKFLIGLAKDAVATEIGRGKQPQNTRIPDDNSAVGSFGTIVVSVFVAAKVGQDIPNSKGSRAAAPAGAVRGPKAIAPVAIVKRIPGSVRAIFRIPYEVVR